MPPVLTIEARNEVTVLMRGLGDTVRAELEKKIWQGMYRIEGSAKDRAPVDRGRLRSSITAEVETGFGRITGRVGTNVQYAKFVEEGARRHFVPFRVAPDLVKWLERKLGLKAVRRGDRYDFYYKGTNTILYRAIKGFMVSGQAQPFIGPAYEEHVDDIVRDLENLQFLQGV